MNKKGKIILILIFILITISIIISLIILNYKESKKIINSNVKVESNTNRVNDVLKTIEDNNY